MPNTRANIVGSGLSTATLIVSFDIPVDEMVTALGLMVTPFWFA